MKTIYITSVERYSGKTAACLALGKRLQANDFQVGYLKPLSLSPWRVGNKIADEDAAFVIEALNLKASPWELSPVVVTPEFLRERLREQVDINLMEQVKAAAAAAGIGMQRRLRHQRNERLILPACASVEVFRCRAGSAWLPERSCDSKKNQGTEGGTGA